MLAEIGALCKPLQTRIKQSFYTKKNITIWSRTAAIQQLKIWNMTIHNNARDPAKCKCTLCSGKRYLASTFSALPGPAFAEDTLVPWTCWDDAPWMREISPTNSAQPWQNDEQQGSINKCYWFFFPLIVSIIWCTNVVINTKGWARDLFNSSGW